MAKGRWIATGALGTATVLGMFGADRVVRKPAPVLDESQRPPSYWMRSISEIPRFRPLDENITVDVAVVGGGFCGLAIAYYLKQLDPSLRVAVLDAQRFGSGASSRNSGGASSYFRGYGTSEESIRGYQLLRTFCVDNDLDVELQEDVPMMTLHRSAKTAANPTLTGEELRHAINSPFYEAAVEGVSNRLHPGKLIAGLVDANQRLGVELYEDSPVARVQPGNPVWLHTPKARVIAKNVALATNAYTPGLGFARDRIMTVHHRVIATRPLTEQEWEISGLENWPYRLEHGSIFTHTVRRTADRRFFYRHVLGHRAFERADWEITAEDVAHGQRELYRRYPWLEGIPIEYEWHGVTGRTRDLWPVAGPIDDHVYIAAGFNGNGVMSTHYFGHLLAHQMLDRPHRDLHMLKAADQHPYIPGEMARHLGFQGWIRAQRLLDGR